jgi:hypothetical protein
MKNECASIEWYHDFIKGAGFQQWLMKMLVNGIFKIKYIPVYCHWAAFSNQYNGA